MAAARRRRGERSEKKGLAVAAVGMERLKRIVLGFHRSIWDTFQLDAEK